MTFKSIILGVAVTAVLLAVLVATRLVVLSPVEHEFEIREIETVSLAEPPAPPEEQLPAEDVPPPPPPALADLRPAVDMTQPVMLVNNLTVDPRLSIDTFFADQPPAPLSEKIKIVRPAVMETAMQPKSLPQVAPALPEAKSEFSLGELDQQPKLLRNPSVIFPRSIKDANSGRVVVRVAILASGRSQFISVVSSTHDDLVPLAKRIASGSRFTPPTRQRNAVKAIMTWPITIKK
ncbi:MAG: energy transducer TonB [Akkermansiaceae bacterium]|nr:energy transducer TonB [Akkermansiaceae bacterium]